MDYYRDSVTAKSWELLKDLTQQFRFVLIGGWAVWMYTKQLKSKDIDMVVEHSRLERLKSSYDIIKNDRLKKYELHQGEVEVDIYVPYYSSPGLPAQDIIQDGRVISGFRLPSRELLVTLKIAAWVSRRASAKGQKDLLDIISLLESKPFNPDVLKKWIQTAQLQDAVCQLGKELKARTRIPELGLNAHQVSRKKKVWLPLIGPI